MTRSFVLTGLALCLITAAGWGQFGDPFLDPGNTVDAQISGVGGGQPQGQVADPFGSVSGVSFGGAPQPQGGFGLGDPFGGVADAFTAFEGEPAGSSPAPFADRITVVRGLWIRDSVTGELLSAPELTTDNEQNKIKYSNDGQTQGDVFEDDEIWSDVDTNDNSYIGPATHTYILYYINMLRLLDALDPLSFAAVSVASPDPVSPLPQFDDYAAHQDQKVHEWNERFLRDFRQPDPITGVISERGEFYPIYVPPPPFSEPLRPSPTLAPPPADFMEQAWVAFQGGTPDSNAVISVRGTGQQQRAGAYYGDYGGPAPSRGVVGEEGDLFGGSAGAQWEGQSSYFGEAQR
jgi:hypothetical protein